MEAIPRLFGLLGGLVVLAFAANRLFRYTRVPDLLVLIGTGLLIGPVLGWVDGNQFRSITHAFGTLALILILFEGGLELRLRETIRHSPGGVLLAVVSYGVTLGLVTLVAWRSLGLSPESCLLVGAVLACTSSSIVIPLLQQLKLREPVKITLLLEASLGDVFGVLTVGYLLDSLGTEGATGGFLTGLAWRVGIPLVAAAVVGAVWSRLLSAITEERFWHVLTFGIVMLLFAGIEAVDASGLIAVLGFGLMLANFSTVEQRLIKPEVDVGVPTGSEHLPVLAFHSELSFLVRTFFFVLLGVVVEFAGTQYIVPTLGIVGAILLARWLAVHMSHWSWRDVGKDERELVIWILPRGLITAVLAIQVFEGRGDEFAFLPAVAFIVILATNLFVIVAGIRGHRPQPATVLEPASESSALNGARGLARHHVSLAGNQSRPPLKG